MLSAIPVTDSFQFKNAMKIYFDVCCLNRPFDDQVQDRIHMESEAIATILGHVDEGKWIWVASEAINLELVRMSDHERKNRVLKMLAGSSQTVRLTAWHTTRAAELIATGFKAMDALHVACAESAQADVFLTTDDRLERLGMRFAKKLIVRVANPWQWLEEMTGK